MKKKLRKILIVTASVIAAMAVLLGVATLLLNTDYVQQRLLRHATTLLTEKLNTHVKAERVRVNIFGPSLALYALHIDDQQGEPLFSIEELTAEVSVESLWEQQVVVQQVKTKGLKARLVKAEGDSVANYQFLIDAFSKKKPDEAKNDSLGEKKGKKWKLNLSPRHLRMKDTHIIYHVDQKKTQVELKQLDMKRRDKQFKLDLNDLHLSTDNGRPHKNQGNPKKGKFDAGHLDLTATLHGTLQLVSPDSMAITLSNTTLQDPTAGIDITDLSLHATTNRKALWLTDLSFKQGETTLQVNQAHITLPNPKTGQELAYTAESVTAHVVLRDIAKPFVPALREFHLPLQFSTQMSGTADKMTFRKVHVNTDDNRLYLNASGHISHLREGKQLTVGFDVDKLVSKQGMAERVINQFIVKKLMMNQLHHLGDISYRGHFDVLGRQEIFRGRLTTRAGDLDFHFTIDGNTHRLHGSFSSGAVKVGEVMEAPAIGDVDLQANFDIDISKQRTAQIRREKGGKLPIGTVNATVNDCSYKRLHIRNITATIESDGADATGRIVQQGKSRQIYCEFIYSESDPKHKVHVTHSGIRFGKQEEASEEPSDSTSTKKKRKEKKEKKTKTKTETT